MALSRKLRAESKESPLRGGGHSIFLWSAAKKRMSLEIGDIGYLYIFRCFAAVYVLIPIDSIYSPPHAAFL